MVKQSGRKLENHLWILALTGISFLVAGSSSAQASGCHSPDRPVLTRSLSWERWQQGGDSLATSQMAPAPPAILPLPCHGETPTLPSFATGLVSADLTPGNILEQPLTLGEHLVFESSDRPSSPITSRLERPPPALGWLIRYFAFGPARCSTGTQIAHQRQPPPGGCGEAKQAT